jgi:hypothetical protein
MFRIFRKLRLPLYGDRRSATRPSCFAMIAIAALTLSQQSFAQRTTEIRRTFTLNATEPLQLDVEVQSGELQILYGRDGEASISGVAKGAEGAKLDDSFFPGVLTVEQNGNHLSIRHVPNPAYPEKGIGIVYRIDVPYRTEVTSRMSRGKQNIAGILGPVKALLGTGEIKASYISKGMQAQVDDGNLDIQVIGERVQAKAGVGNISCSRLAQGVSAETGDGDINLTVVGPSTATIKTGNGRIEVGGARGSFIGSTDAGDIHIRSVPHDDWQLSSISGSVRLELPPSAKFELDASTDSGNLQSDRDDIGKNGLRLHSLGVGGSSGNRIKVHTRSGKIAIL